MKWILIILFTFFAQAVSSQKLNKESKLIKAAFDKLSSNRNSKSLQKKYVKVFPADRRTFLKVFSSPTFDQLYMNSHKYIEAFGKCAVSFPQEVIYKAVDISKNLKWEADAVNYLRDLNVSLAAKNIEVFVAKYKLLNSKDQIGLIKLYADAENHKAYPEYQTLINKLKSSGYRILASTLERARAKRIEEQDH